MFKKQILHKKPIGEYKYQGFSFCLKFRTCSSSPSWLPNQSRSRILSSCFSCNSSPTFLETRNLASRRILAPGCASLCWKIQEVNFCTGFQAYFELLFPLFSHSSPSYLALFDFAKEAHLEGSSICSKTSFLSHLFVWVKFHSVNLVKHTWLSLSCFSPHYREYVSHLLNTS